MKYLFSKLLLLIWVIPSVFPLAANARLHGLERMERFDLLPCLLQGTQVRQVSSHDRSGGNNDGFNGAYSALYVDENNEYVLFDEIGAGCLYRFWMTYRTNDDPNYYSYRIRFYFDGETEPRLDKSVLDFFDDEGAPLEFPLVGYFDRSSNGCYCYLPFPYRERLKITLSGRPLFYNMTYHRFDEAAGIDSWTGNEDQSNVMALWNAVGTDPKPTQSNCVVSGNYPLTATATGILFSVTGAGAVQSIKLDPSPATTNVLSDIWIQMNWDGGEAEVDVPIGDFFGSGKYEINVSSLPIGMKTAGDWYCYFPMPYWESAVIQLVNKGNEPLSALPFEIQYTTNAYDQATTGYFHALFHEETFVKDGRDFNFIQASGRGHVVGLSLFMHGTGTGGYRHTGYLEGDERIHVDGNKSPCVHGTGNEDYFNAGWYFNRGAFNRPVHGCPWEDHMNTNRPNFTQAYRFHLSDVIPFNQSVRFGIEHGPANDEPGTYSSVTYFYKMAGTASGLDLVADLDLGDAWSESLYAYQRAAGAASVANVWSYGGDDDNFFLDDAGYSYTGGMATFSISLPGSEGLLLRRRTDQGVGGQQAHVYIDDLLAGTWYEADHNFESVKQRWLDSEFMVPAHLLKGKTEVRISIVPLPSSNPWNEYRYWVYSVRPVSACVDRDFDRLPDEWELGFNTSLDLLAGDRDSDSDGYSDLQEYIAGTNPLDASSFPTLAYYRPGEGVGVLTCLGRQYRLQESVNLLSNDWTTVGSVIPGTGSLLTIPCSIDSARSYFRLLVEKP
jgi:hypothetical protein